MQELKPCPFCGDNDVEETESSVIDIKGNKKIAIYCNSCFCEGSPQETLPEAIEAWNRRA